MPTINPSSLASAYSLQRPQAPQSMASPATTAPAAPQAAPPGAPVPAQDSTRVAISQTGVDALNASTAQGTAVTNGMRNPSTQAVVQGDPASRNGANAYSSAAATRMYDMVQSMSPNTPSGEAARDLVKPLA
ncbi:hypothetical protein [Zoogloea sp.]|uniref:hypothetical protein n=1 Tax=Zoogloea sp. TaxID=49181 RepID=UPI0026282C24|nr:hypothetical protein [Zoogloea sp.]MDD3352813.1 hypothetical protein [Zoogloea sp.]